MSHVLKDTMFIGIKDLEYKKRELKKEIDDISLEIRDLKKEYIKLFSKYKINDIVFYNINDSLSLRSRIIDIVFNLKKKHDILYKILIDISKRSSYVTHDKLSKSIKNE